MKRVLYVIGMIFLLLGAIPAFFAYPNSNGPNSGPLNLRDLILIISYENWLYFLILGLVLYLLILFQKLRKT